jgi:hypothetical protein
MSEEIQKIVKIEKMRELSEKLSHFYVQKMYVEASELINSYAFNFTTLFKISEITHQLSLDNLIRTFNSDFQESLKSGQFSEKARVKKIIEILEKLESLHISNKLLIISFSLASPKKNQIEKEQTVNTEPEKPSSIVTFSDVTDYVGLFSSQSFRIPVQEIIYDHGIPILRRPESTGFEKSFHYCPIHSHSHVFEKYDEDYNNIYGQIYANGTVYDYCYMMYQNVTFPEKLKNAILKFDGEISEEVKLIQSYITNFKKTSELFIKDQNSIIILEKEIQTLHKSLINKIGNFENLQKLRTIFSNDIFDHLDSKDIKTIRKICTPPSFDLSGLFETSVLKKFQDFLSNYMKTFSGLHQKFTNELAKNFYSQIFESLSTSNYPEELNNISEKIEKIEDVLNLNPLKVEENASRIRKIFNNQEFSRVNLSEIEDLPSWIDLLFLLSDIDNKEFDILEEVIFSKFSSLLSIRDYDNQLTNTDKINFFSLTFEKYLQEMSFRNLDTLTCNFLEKKSLFSLSNQQIENFEDWKSNIMTKIRQHPLILMKMPFAIRNLTTSFTELKNLQDQISESFQLLKSLQDEKTSYEKKNSELGVVKEHHQKIKKLIFYQSPEGDFSGLSIDIIKIMINVIPLISILSQRLVSFKNSYREDTTKISTIITRLQKTRSEIMKFFSDIKEIKIVEMISVIEMTNIFYDIRKRIYLEMQVFKMLEHNKMQTFNRFMEKVSKILTLCNYEYYNPYYDKEFFIEDYQDNLEKEILQKVINNIVFSKLRQVVILQLVDQLANNMLHPEDFEYFSKSDVIFRKTFSDNTANIINVYMRSYKKLGNHLLESHNIINPGPGMHLLYNLFVVVLQKFQEFRDNQDYGNVEDISLSQEDMQEYDQFIHLFSLQQNSKIPTMTFEMAVNSENFDPFLTMLTGKIDHPIFVKDTKVIIDFVSPFIPSNTPLELTNENVRNALHFLHPFFTTAAQNEGTISADLFESLIEKHFKNDTENLIINLLQTISIFQDDYRNVQRDKKLTYDDYIQYYQDYDFYQNHDYLVIMWESFRNIFETLIKHDINTFNASISDSIKIFFRNFNKQLENLQIIDEYLLEN